MRWQRGNVLHSGRLTFCNRVSLPQRPCVWYNRGNRSVVGLRTGKGVLTAANSNTPSSYFLTSKYTVNFLIFSSVLQRKDKNALRTCHNQYGYLAWVSW